MSDLKRQVPILIALEGNISSGKSTFLEWFKDDDDIKILPEPIGNWTNIGQEDLLALKYDNSKRWEFTFQIQCDLSRLIQLRDTQFCGQSRIIERSLFSAHRIFVQMQKDSGDLSLVESEVLSTWSNHVTSSNNGTLVKPDLFLYLKADPSICWSRMNMRNRQAERTVTLSYLQSLHELHEKVFVTEAATLPAPVVVLDGNLDENDMPTNVLEALAAIDMAKAKKAREEEVLEAFMRELSTEAK
jgi:deoxynucleoside kinase